MLPRPPADPVGPGQESVWDYPRPPALQRVEKPIRIIVEDAVLADTTAAYRVLETSHPPVYYIPPADIDIGRLVKSPGGSFCEWKGGADYWAYQTPTRSIAKIAWSYPRPTPTFEPITGYLAFYAHKVDQATVDGQDVTPQPGNFYGGWITPDIIGPYKGIPGSMGW